MKRKHDLRAEHLKQYFFDFAEKSQAVFWIRSPDYKEQIYVSPAYEKIWGRSCESLYTYPDSWINTLVPEDRQGEHTVPTRFQLLEELGPSANFNSYYQIERPDGGRAWIKDTSFPIYDEEDRFIGFAGIAEDITEAVCYEQALRDAKQRAELANRAKSEFLATMSHELRTPLNAILGVAQVLRSKKELPQDLIEYIDMIKDAGNNLLSLVNDVLDFARLEAGKLSLTREVFDLKLLVSQVVKGVSYQVKEKELSLTTSFAKGTPERLIGDAKRIRQILLNLLSNAIKFTEKGDIKVQISCLKKIEDQALIYIVVKDTGIGISEDKMDFIFEKFSQIDATYNRKHQGIGLGLAITKELVEKMGGLITVKSKTGEGSEFGFTLTLQVSPQEKVNKVLEKKRKTKALAPDIGVLIVEDNVINQKIVKLMLEERGCKVTIASNGVEALNYLLNSQSFSLILMDISLPDRSGFDIVKEIREHDFLKNIPIVAMTAHILERDRDRCFAVGMNDVIAKPILQEDLIEMLQRFCKME